MKSSGIMFLGIAWIVTSPLWFFAIENTAMGIIWLGGGIVELTVGLIRRNSEKKSGKTLSEKGDL